MTTKIKGVTCAYAHCEYFTFPEKLYSSIYLAFLTSKLFNVPFYLRHEQLDGIYEGGMKEETARDWKKIFHFFLHTAIPLEESDLSLIVNYRDLPNKYGLSNELMVEIDFIDLYEIFLDNYDVYAAKVHEALSPLFKALNQFEPKENFYKQGKINIAIDLSSTNSDLQNLEKNQQDKDSEIKDEEWLVNLRQQELVSNQIQNIQTNVSSAYSNLIDKIINEINSQAGGEIEIHLFSTKDRAVFSELITKFGSKLKINLHLNVSKQEVFYFLSTSNYFIGANSLLSWLATLVNPNPSFIKFPFSYVPGPNTQTYVDGTYVFKDQFAQEALSKKIW